MCDVFENFPVINDGVVVSAPSGDGEKVNSDSGALNPPTVCDGPPPLDKEGFAGQVLQTEPYPLGAMWASQPTRFCVNLFNAGNVLECVYTFFGSGWRSITPHPSAKAATFSSRRKLPSPT